MAVSQQEAIPLDTRARILFLTAGIVLLTILINGATCKLLVQKLRLVNPTQGETKEMSGREGERRGGGREGGQKGLIKNLVFFVPMYSPPSLLPAPPLAAERELFIRATNLVETKLGIFVERKLKKDRYLGNADWNVVYRYILLPSLPPSLPSLR